MKIRTKLLSALLVCIAATAWNAMASNFTVNVKVGSAEAEPALIFGQAAAASQIPYPPFSAMFGVKDIYLANPGNFGTESTVSGDLSRLGTDIRTDAADNAWVIVVSSDATLYFDKSGAPALSVIDSTDGAVASELGDSLSVKAGVDYTISVKSVDDVRSVVVAPDPAKARLILEQAEGSELFSAKSDALEAIQAAGDAAFSVVVTDDAPVTITNNAGAPRTLTAGWCIDLTSDKITGISKKSATEWTVSFSGEGTLVVNAYAASASLKPIAVYAVAGGLKVLEVNCLLKGSGTLDFNDDGALSNVDMYLFANFITAYNANDGEMEYIEAADVKGNQKSLKNVDAEAALAILVQDASADLLDFNGDGALSNVDMYLFANFITAYNANDGEMEYIEAADVKGNQKSLKNVDAEAALEKLKALAGSIAK